MVEQQFRLDARVSSDRPDRIRSILPELLPGSHVREEEEEFYVEAEVSGSSATELNRALLSGLRRVEKRTRLRAEWRTEDGMVYRFFDYVLKSTRST